MNTGKPQATWCTGLFRPYYSVAVLMSGFGCPVVGCGWYSWTPVGWSLRRSTLSYKTRRSPNSIENGGDRFQPVFDDKGGAEKPRSDGN